jgi:hypothetical protein
VGEKATPDEHAPAYERTADDYNFAFTFMVQRRFKGNRKGDHERRLAHTQPLPKGMRPHKRKIRHTQDSELECQSNAMANTAANLDENGHKVVYQKSKDNLDGEI